jgi:hypothetical protein
LLDFILDAEAGFGLEGTVVALPTSLLEVLERFIFGFESRDAVFDPPPPLANERGLLASVVSPPSVASSTIGRASFKPSSCVSVVIERFLSTDGTMVVAAISPGTERADRRLLTERCPSWRRESISFET